MDASSTFQDSLPVTSDQMLEMLRAKGLSFEYYEHAALRTVDDAKTVQGSLIPMGAGYIDIKNLYLRDRKKRNYLVILEQDRAVDLKALGSRIGAGNLSFGSSERLMEYLGVRPGAVSPLAMFTGVPKGVQIFMDRALEHAERIHVHPLVNDRTVTLRSGDLLDLLSGWGAPPTWIDF
ncbi:MAG: prolyl-tRNA synthetase associated domain-containing protein [Pseudomonadota bacterium]